MEHLWTKKWDVYDNDSWLDSLAQTLCCEWIPRRRFFSDATPGDSTQNVEEIFLMSQGFQMRKWCLFDVVFFLYMFFLSHGKWSSLQAKLDHKKIPQKFNIAPEKW